VEQTTREICARAYGPQARSAISQSDDDHEARRNRLKEGKTD